MAFGTNLHVHVLVHTQFAWLHTNHNFKLRSLLSNDQQPCYYRIQHEQKPCMETRITGKQMYQRTNFSTKSTRRKNDEYLPNESDKWRTQTPNESMTNEQTKKKRLLKHT